MKAPERIESERLLLRRPLASDAERIFARYANDVEVTRYLSWPRHESVEQTRAFLAFSDAEWEAWPAGPYLIELRASGELIGSTGFGFQDAHEAATGYVLARDAWGRGYATEALRALITLCEPLGIRRLFAQCHPNHSASQRVLEKCGFIRDESSRDICLFPQLGISLPVLRYTRTFPDSIPTPISS